MISKFIKEGYKVELSTLEKLNKVDDSKKIYQSRIQGIISEDRLEITMPMDGTKLILLPVDSEFDMFVYAENCLYQCMVRIIDRYKSNNVYILAVELVTNLRKYQRRDYYRYSCALAMDVRMLSLDEIKAIEEKKAFEFESALATNKGVIVDISGGGIRFMSNQEYEAGNLIKCLFFLLLDDGPKKYEISGRVLSTREVPNRQGTFEHRVQFVAVNETIREEIIRFIFNQERKDRKKENGS